MTCKPAGDKRAGRCLCSCLLTPPFASLSTDHFCLHVYTAITALFQSFSALNACQINPSPPTPAQCCWSWWSATGTYLAQRARPCWAGANTGGKAISGYTAGATVEDIALHIVTVVDLQGACAVATVQKLTDLHVVTFAAPPFASKENGLHSYLTPIPIVARAALAKSVHVVAVRTSIGAIANYATTGAWSGCLQSINMQHFHQALNAWKVTPFEPGVLAEMMVCSPGMCWDYQCCRCLSSHCLRRMMQRRPCGYSLRCRMCCTAGRSWKGCKPIGRTNQIREVSSSSGVGTASSYRLGKSQFNIILPSLAVQPSTAPADHLRTL